VTEISYEALDQDWDATMTGAYRELGLGLTTETHAAMARQMELEIGGAHMAHRHDLKRFEQTVVVNRA